MSEKLLRTQVEKDYAAISWKNWAISSLVTSLFFLLYPIAYALFEYFNYFKEIYNAPHRGLLNKALHMFVYPIGSPFIIINHILRGFFTTKHSEIFKSVIVKTDTALKTFVSALSKMFSACFSRKNKDLESDNADTLRDYNINIDIESYINKQKKRSHATVSISLAEAQKTTASVEVSQQNTITEVPKTIVSVEASQQNTMLSDSSNTNTSDESNDKDEDEDNEDDVGLHHAYLTWFRAQRAEHLNFKDYSLNNRAVAHQALHVNHDESPLPATAYVTAAPLLG